MDELGIEIHFGQQVSEETQQEVTKVVSGVAEKIREALNKAGWSIYICSTLQEVKLDSLGTIEVLPFLSNITLYNDKAIIVPETVTDAYNNQTANLNFVGSLYHAISHAIDTLANSYMDTHIHNYFSSSESFKYAHVSDLGRLNQKNKTILSYYTDNSDESRSELFAEGVAALYGAGEVYTIDVISKYFPAVMKRIKSILSAIEEDKNLDNTDSKEDNEE